ncbi:MAG: site-specific integrase [Betaproteobacteria bacterium]|nr:site-specific integrase [Betaproteobacteria bacterium]
MPGKPKQSKKYGLGKLAQDWRERIFESIHSERLKAAVAVLSATGCRPAELEMGVIVRLKDETLQLGIRGAKIDPEKGRGQPLRLLVVDRTTPWGRHLEKLVLDSPGQTITVAYDAGGISQRLREKSRELWPRRKSLVSAYCYRHFLGKSMRESGESAEKIAFALGHASDLSQLSYGRAGGGRKLLGQHGILAATATNPVRHSAKLDRLAKMTTWRTFTPVTT